MRYYYLYVVLLLTSCTKDVEYKYYSSGEVKLTDTSVYNDGDGVLTEFYKNGKVKRTVNIAGGKKSGISQEFDSLGNLIGNYTYRSNGLEGQFKLYFPNGSVKVAGNYSDGEPQGEGIEYYETGEVHKYYFYDKGSLKYYKAFQKDGEFYDSKLPIKITEVNEINTCGDNLKLNIELEYSQENNVRLGVIIGHLNEENILQDTISVIGSKSKKVGYEVVPATLEEQRLEGVLYEIRMPENKIVGHYYLRYNIACRVE